MSTESKANDVEYVDCPICDSASNVVWLDDGKLTRYVRCTGCGTVYASPRASRQSRYAWLDEAFSLSSDVFALMAPRRPALEREARFIQQYIKGGRMLDVGCSIGTFFEFFPPPQWERYGVELSPSAAAYAAETYSSHVHAGNLASAQYSDGYFDLASVIDTLYYLDDPVAELREIRRVLKPDGLLAIEIPEQAYILHRNYGLLPLIIDRRWSRAGSNSSYIFWFSPSGLSRLLAKCGFQPIAWHAVPSPRHSNRLVNAVSDAYLATLNVLIRLSPKALTWSPKYLCLAKQSYFSSCRNDDD